MQPPRTCGEAPKRSPDEPAFLRDLRRASAAVVLYYLSDARERHGRRGCPAGGLSALAAGVGGGDPLAKVLPLGDRDPPLHRSPPLREGAARGVRGSLAAGASAKSRGCRYGHA